MRRMVTDAEIEKIGGTKLYKHQIVFSSGDEFIAISTQKEQAQYNHLNKFISECLPGISVISAEYTTGLLLYWQDISFTFMEAEEGLIKVTLPEDWTITDTVTEL